MRTRMNIISRSLRTVTFLTVILLSSSVSAQKSFTSLDFKNITNNILKSSKAEILDAFYDRNEVFVEEEIAFEEWMMNLEEFGKRIDSAEIDISDKLEEPGMNEIFNEKSVESFDERIELEDWMINFDNTLLTDDRIVEKEVELESWMSDLKSW